MKKNKTSDEISSEMHRLIPGGSHTYSKGDDQFPGNAPKIMLRAKGAYSWDLDNTKYLDWAMGNRVSSLGHANDYVDAKVFDAMRMGEMIMCEYTFEGKKYYIGARLDRGWFYEDEEIKEVEGINWGLE